MGRLRRSRWIPRAYCFKGLDNPVRVARYHSLAADKESLPSELRVTACTADGQVMAVEHERYPIYGMQFHPESVLTPGGANDDREFCGTIKAIGGRDDDKRSDYETFQEGRFDIP